MSDKIRVLLLGFTGLGAEQDHQQQMYAPAFVADVGYEIVATSDLTRGGAASKVAAELGVAHRDSWQDALCGGDIDLVSVCVPLEWQPEVVNAALRAGKHVLVDKPITDPPAATAIAELASERELVCMPAHHQRLSPVVTAACEAVAAGRVGLPWNVQADLFVAGKEAGELLNLAAYPIDVVLALVAAPVRRVYARLGNHWHEASDAEDFALLVLDHDHGITSTIAVGRQRALSGAAPGQPVVHRYRISGSHGVLDVDVLRPGVAVRTAGGTRQSLARADSVGQMLRELRVAIRARRPSSPNATDAERVAGVLAAARSSVADNRPGEVTA